MFERKVIMTYNLKGIKQNTLGTCDIFKAKKTGFEGASKVMKYLSILTIRCCICFGNVSASISGSPRQA